jgi:uncharacterized membrane protein YbhN (UPF0104 family)
MSATAAPDPIPDELDPRRFRRRLLELLAVVAAVAVLLIVGPSLGSVRSRLGHASGSWLAIAVAFEIASCLSYVALFRAVFCPRMSWRLSYQIGMAEQAGNSLLPASGAGGLALGVWALRRGGVSAEHIGRRTAAFYFLSSLANVGAVILFALLFAVGALGHDPDAPLTYAFGAAATAATALVLALPAILARRETRSAVRTHSGRFAKGLGFVRRSLELGIRDAVTLLRHNPGWVLVGSLGTTAFDVAVMWVAFEAFGPAPPLAVVVLGYLIGQLGGNIPVPGGIGGLDAGLIAVFALYHVPLASAAAAVLIYHMISLWTPALLGSVAFVQLRNALRRTDEPAHMCLPLAEPLHTAQLPGSLD